MISLIVIVLCVLIAVFTVAVLAACMLSSRYTRLEEEEEYAKSLYVNSRDPLPRLQGDG